MACSYSSIYYYSGYQVEASGQLYAAASIPPRTGSLCTQFKESWMVSRVGLHAVDKKVLSAQLCHSSKQSWFLDIVVYIFNLVIGTAYKVIATLIILFLWPGARTLHKHT
jgi:hypothetical protein